jgi:hypothetical protein
VSRESVKRYLEELKQKQLAEIKDMTKEKTQNTLNLSKHNKNQYSWTGYVPIELCDVSIWGIEPKIYNTRQEAENDAFKLGIDYKVDAAVMKR